jgi:hypothetical protein
MAGEFWREAVNSYMGRAARCFILFLTRVSIPAPQLPQQYTFIGFKCGFKSKLELRQGQPDIKFCILDVLENRIKAYLRNTKA